MSDYAVCTDCKQLMAVGNGCTAGSYNDFVDRVERARIPYQPDTDRSCHDCNVTAGQLHHPGCDMERCPRCGGQAIACDCIVMPDEDDAYGYEDLT